MSVATAEGREESIVASMVADALEKFYVEKVQPLEKGMRKIVEVIQKLSTQVDKLGDDVKRLSTLEERAIFSAVKAIGEIKMERVLSDVANRITKMPSLSPDSILTAVREEVGKVVREEVRRVLESFQPQLEVEVPNHLRATLRNLEEATKSLLAGFMELEKCVHGLEEDRTTLMEGMVDLKKSTEKQINGLREEIAKLTETLKMWTEQVVKTLEAHERMLHELRGMGEVGEEEEL